MAGGLARSGRRRGRRGGARGTRLSEINVTPFVDVMLVLLIVFMVTAPLLTVSIPIGLPRTDAKQSAAETEPLAITAPTAHFLAGNASHDRGIARLRAISREGYDRAIYIRGD